MIVVEKQLGIPAERGKALRCAEVWFSPDDETSVSGFDILCFNQCAMPISAGGKPFLTLHIALEMADAALFAQFDRETQYEIRRCGRTDGIHCRMNERPDETDVATFLEFYRQFSVDKGLANAATDCAWYARGLRQFHASGGLMISAAHLPDGQPACMHTYLIDDSRARLINSASVFRHSDSKFRSMVGRANRSLHWHDMLIFKNRGRRIYDLGGITTASGDTISKFKASFGGMQVKEYNFVYKAVSARGRAAMDQVSQMATTATAAS